MKTKLVRPLLVENNSNSAIFWKHCKTNIVSLWKDYFSLDKNWYGFNLILISLEPIEYDSYGNQDCEISNLVYDAESKEIGKVSHVGASFNFKGTLQFPQNDDLHKNRHCTFNCHKVIATQDQLSSEYIAKFVEQYNNGKVEDIEIEIITMNEGYTDANDYPYQETDIPKLTNGFVTIVNKEPILYTEEEIKVYLKKIVRSTYPLGEFNEDVSLFINDWFEQNEKK